jgi:hypothetical protein
MYNFRQVTDEWIRLQLQFVLEEDCIYKYICLKSALLLLDVEKFRIIIIIIIIIIFFNRSSM